MAVYLVLQKINLRETAQTLTKINIGWFLVAFLFFNISKIISAFRLQKFLEVINVYISNTIGIKLCYVGMFYNLFLPGGIGGDGYKIYILKKWNQAGSLKKIFTTALLDRVSGMIALVFLAIVLFAFTTLKFILRDTSIAVFYFLILISYYPLLFVVSRFFLRSFHAVFYITNIQSIGVQIFQVVCAFFLLQAFGINQYRIDYLDLFLISSVVAVLPITIGGIGARELVFIYGYEYLAIDKNTAVAFSLAFFILTVVSSLIGATLNLPKNGNSEK